MPAKEYVIRLTVDESGAVKIVDQLDTSLKQTQKTASRTGSEISKGLGEAKRGIVGIVNDLTGGLASKFMDVKDAITGSIAGMKGLKAAIAGTGIGVLVLAVGLIAENWEDIKGYIDGSNQELKTQQALLQEQVRLAQYQLDLLTAQDNTLRLQGKTEKEILEQKMVKINQLIWASQLELANQKLLIAGDVERAKLQSKFLEMQFGALGKKLGDWWFDPATVEKEGNLALEESEKKIKELINQRDGFQLQIDQIDDNAFKERKAAALKALEEQSKLEKDKQDAVVFAHQSRTSEQREHDAQMLADQKATADESRRIAKEALDKQLDDARKKAEEEEALARKGKEFKIQTASETFAILADLIASDNARGTKAARKQFHVMKAFAVSQAIIDTYGAINAAFYNAQKNPTSIPFPAYPYIQAGLAAAKGFATVKKIVAQQFTANSSGSDSGGGGGGGGGGGNAFAGFNTQLPTAPLATVQQQVKPQPVQAYVLAGAVTDNTNARKKIEDQARL